VPGRLLRKTRRLRPETGDLQLSVQCLDARAGTLASHAGAGVPDRRGRNQPAATQGSGQTDLHQLRPGQLRGRHRPGDREPAGARVRLVDLQHARPGRRRLGPIRAAYLDRSWSGCSRSRPWRSSRRSGANEIRILSRYEAVTKRPMCADRYPLSLGLGSRTFSTCRVADLQSCSRPVATYWLQKYWRCWYLGYATVYATACVE